MRNNYEVIPFAGSLGDSRYCVVDDETGEVLDDAQGYGYKSVQKAHAAWTYKSRSDPDRLLIAEKKKLVQDWCATHKDVVEGLETEAFYALKEGRKFGAKDIQKVFEASGLELPCSAADFARYWG